jgi:pimeloyl-ACP methyl ester carboxylesterase
MARFVLVHGAFGGAWCWEPLVRELEAAGHTAEAFDLPGAGADPTPVEEVTLDAYADRICQQLAESGEPAILVGHSMGGVGITHAAGRCPERIALLVYVAAFLPRDGQSLLDLTQLPEGADDQIQANLVVEGDPPVATLSAEASRAAGYGCCSEEVAAWALERRGRQPVAPMATPVAIDEQVASTLPRAYVHCTQDRSIPPALQLRMIRENPCFEVIELDTDHSPALSRTTELAEALDRLARTAVTAGAP